MRLTYRRAEGKWTISLWGCSSTYDKTDEHKNFRSTESRLHEGPPAESRFILSANETPFCRLSVAPFVISRKLVFMVFSDAPIMPCAVERGGGDYVKVEMRELFDRLPEPGGLTHLTDSAPSYAARWRCFWGSGHEKTLSKVACDRCKNPATLGKESSPFYLTRHCFMRGLRSSCTLAAFVHLLDFARHMVLGGGTILTRTPSSSFVHRSERAELNGVGFCTTKYHVHSRASMQTFAATSDASMCPYHFCSMSCACFPTCSATGRASRSSTCLRTSVRRSCGDSRRR